MLRSSLRILIGLGLGSALALGVPSLPAKAATASSTFQVSASVQATCLISAGNLNFGTYTGTVATATSALSVTCTNTTPYNIGLDAGLSSGATVTTRAMTGTGGATLNYGLYQDATLTTNWGNTVGTDTLGGTGNGSAQAITVYGRLPASQYVAPGAYSDTITATVNY